MISIKHARSGCLLVLLFFAFGQPLTGQLTATVSGTTIVNQGDDSPDITFTGYNGTAPYMFTYRVNDGPDQTVSTLSDESGSTIGNKKLVFIHHSTGGYLLSDGGYNYGGLALLLKDSGYFVSDICYGWDAPLNDNIGSYTDIGHWYNWFADETLQSNGESQRDNIMNAVYIRYSQDAYSLQNYGTYSRLSEDPGGENEIVVIKSCYPNSSILADYSGSTISDIFGEAVGPEYSEINVRGLYNTILPYMLSRPDKMFVIITAPSLSYNENGNPDRARSFNNWLVKSWLQDAGHANENVFVWDYFNVMTDIDNHHWVVDDYVVHHTEEDSGNTTVYYNNGDEHPSSEVARKAASEFSHCLNTWYDVWRNWLEYPVYSYNTASVSVPTEDAGKFVYSLLGVRDESGTSATVSGSATVTVNTAEVPIATVNASDTEACVGDDNPEIVFTGSGGITPYTFYFTVNGGAVQNVTTSDGNSAIVKVSTSVPDQSEFSLVSVEDGDGISNSVSGDVVVTVTSLPVAEISGNTVICKGSSTTLAASGGNSYAWFRGTEASGTVLSTLAEYYTPPLTSDEYYTVMVTNNNCSATSTVMVDVADLPFATAEIDYSEAMVDGNFPVITFTGSGGNPPYIFTYSINDGETLSVTSSESGNTATIDVPTSMSGSYVYTLLGVQEGGTLACFNELSVEITVLITSSEKTFVDDSVIIYPNPASSSLSISIPDFISLDAVVEIVDMNSKIIYLGERNPGTLTIDVSKFVEGVYFVVIRDPGIIVSRKFIIKR